MKQPYSGEPVRVSVAQAKSQLSRLLRTVGHQSVVIHNRGRDVARLVASGSTAGLSKASTPFAEFFVRLESLRRRLKVKGVDFEPEPAVIHPVDPFGADR